MRHAFDGVDTFLAVARWQSFVRAAAEMGVTKSAVSQQVKALEARVGMPLFRRTTRSVTLTEAGEKLLRRASVARAAMDDAWSEIEGLRAKPSGLLRVTVPRMAARYVLGPMLAAFREAHPNVTVEVSIDDAFVDLGAAGFDAGIRLGERVSQDMVAVRLTEDIRWHVVGAPAYFARRGVPSTLADLVHHEAIHFRLPSSDALYRWELRHRGRDIEVDVPAAAIVNDGDLGHTLACAGVGLLYAPHFSVARDLGTGALVSVLRSLLPVSAGFYLYFPRGTERQPKVRAFVDALRARAKAHGTSAKVTS